jgi:hypothetical protein
VNPPLPDPLGAALVANSSRLSPPRTPWPTVAIHAAVLLAWVLLFARAFGQGGLWAWAVGGAYIAYDTVLLAFVAWQTWRLLRPSPEPTGLATRPRIGVLVAAHNEAAVLPITIAALLAQTGPTES